MSDSFTTAEWSDIINQAMADIGAIGAGQTISTSAQNDAFFRLGQLIDSFSADPLLALYEAQHSTFALEATIFAYTLGPTGSFVTSASPVRVTGATSYSGNFRQPMRLVSIDQWDKEAANPKGMQTTLPELLGADTAWPNINLRVHYPPIGGASMEVNYWIPLSQPASVSQAVSFPPGFQRAIQKNLALTLYPQYARERGVDPVLQKEASESLEFIRNVNRSMLAEGLGQGASQATLNPPATPQTQV